METSEPHTGPSPSAGARCSSTSPGERGYTLAGVLVILSVVAVILAFTLPKQWSMIMKRERELHTIFAMKQYAVGIQEFQRVHGALPVSLEQLENQSQPRVMRKMYPNPLSGELDWVLVPAAQPGQPGQPGGAPQQQPGQTVGQQPSSPAPPGRAQPGQPFIGVRPPQTGESIIELNGQNQYQNWSLTVLDLQRMQQPAPGANPQAPANPQSPQNPGR